MAKPNYKRLTLKLTGMSSEEYDKQYKTFSKQVRNFNRVTGSNYQAARQLYNRFKYGESPATKAILSVSKTQAHKKGGESPTRSQLKAAEEYVKQIWAGAGQHNASVQLIIDSIGANVNGEILTPDKANKILIEWAARYKSRHKESGNDPAINSETENV